MSDLVKGFLALLGINILLFLIFLFTDYYYPLFVLIHIVSVLFVWGFIGVKIFKDNKKNISKLDIIFCLILLFSALFVRFDRVDSLPRGMYGDEITVAKFGIDLLQRGQMPPYVAETYWHPTPLLYITGISVETFGRSFTTIRLPNIIFGALSIITFYILLRLFFSEKVAFVGGIMMAVSYPHVILSRLAYEPIPSLVFQLLAVIFLVLYHRTHRLMYVIGVSLSIAGGMYTYLNFRAFALLMLIAVMFVIVSKIKAGQRSRHCFIFLVTLFLSLVPLVSYAIKHPSEFFGGRAQYISVFASNLPIHEVFMEIWGALIRTLGLFTFMIGDPNPGKNPSNVPMFDPITLIFFYIGLLFALKKSKTVFFFSLALLIPPIVSDIFSLERIPEFHYWGLGHPNTLRVSGFMVPVIFLAVYGMYYLYHWIKKQNKYTAHTILFPLVLISLVLNYYWYFGQEKTHFGNFMYNYYVNGTPLIEVSNIINSSDKEIAYVPLSLFPSDSSSFFVRSEKELIPYDSSNLKELENIVHGKSFAVIDLQTENRSAIIEVINKNTSLFNHIEYVRDPMQNPAVILINNN